MTTRDNLDYTRPDQYSKAEESNNTFIPNRLSKFTTKDRSISTPQGAILTITENEYYKLSMSIEETIKALLEIKDYTNYCKFVGQAMRLAYKAGLNGGNIPLEGKIDG